MAETNVVRVEEMHGVPQPYLQMDKRHDREAPAFAISGPFLLNMSNLVILISCASHNWLVPMIQ